ncbi:MAG TPA: tannase/feruloyl esterase family alpha/beta hydrolase [Terracidiphilus sp.]|nr:tannase/feruloyl esterase family alpha/beta hydrolase [Terracidiphilus sp.]
MRHGMFQTVLFGMALSWLLCGAVAKADSCTDIAGLHLQNTVIQSATMVPAGTPEAIMPNLPPRDLHLPRYCKVEGSIHERIGADKQHYATRFEVRLPDNWNGKFLFQGGGGLDGVVRPAIGFTGFGTPTALTRGYAVASTDAGHEGMANSIFGKEQKARLDYAYAAIDDVTRVSKELMAQYYGKPAAHSYFDGCSNGGRQAMMAAQRFPLEFDGIVAGDPGFRLSHAAIGEAWDTETFDSIAPVDKDGHPILSAAFSQADLDLVSKAVLEKCDALDGLKDGEINNVSACRFDPEVLTCKPAQTSGCLKAKQVKALKKAFGGAHNSTGERLYASWPYDAGIASMGWRMWKLGTSPTAKSNALNVMLGAPALRDYFVHPYISGFDPEHPNFDAIDGEVEQTSIINDPTSTDYGTFAARGGRMILYEGMSDPVFSANDIIDYYKRFIRDSGGLEQAQSVARLFLVPGMTHCGQGPATDQFDALTALERWVEDGEAPAKIQATGRAFPGRSRPLCPFPAYAAYVGSGNSEDAASFVCKAPSE